MCLRVDGLCWRRQHHNKEQIEEASYDVEEGYLANSRINIDIDTQQ